jgi:hypothetical protein
MVILRRIWVASFFLDAATVERPTNQFGLFGFVRVDVDEKRNDALATI